jgi:flagellar assembly factor FliW
MQTWGIGFTMPQIPTKYFGSLEYGDADVVQFPCGLPAFEEEVQFLLIEPADLAPLQFLQSMREPSLCFLALPILAIDPGYQLAMTSEDLVSLQLETSRQPSIGSDIECLAVMAMPENGPPSVNLLAPIVINRRNRWGVQAIRVDSAYSHEHSLVEPEAICS